MIRSFYKPFHLGQLIPIAVVRAKELVRDKVRNVLHCRQPCLHRIDKGCLLLNGKCGLENSETT